jgi:putative endonuclease
MCVRSLMARHCGFALARLTHGRQFSQPSRSSNAAIFSTRIADPVGFGLLSAGTIAAIPQRVPHYVYILLCADQTFYVGYTSDIATRVRQDNEGRGCQYTSTRVPVQLVYCESKRTEREALKRERQIKRWTRAKKAALIAGAYETLNKLSPTPRRLRK